MVNVWNGENSMDAPVRVVGIDLTSNRYLFEHRAREGASPASLTKVMALMVVADVMTRGNTDFNFNTVLRVPEIAYR